MNPPGVTTPPLPSPPHDDNDHTREPSPPPTAGEHGDVPGTEADDRDVPANPPPTPTRQDR